METQIYNAKLAINSKTAANYIVTLLEGLSDALL